MWAGVASWPTQRTRTLSVASQIRSTQLSSRATTRIISGFRSFITAHSPTNAGPPPAAQRPPAQNLDAGPETGKPDSRAARRPIMKNVVRRYDPAAHAQEAAQRLDRLAAIPRPARRVDDAA